MGARSLDRARRWLDRIRPLVEGSSGNAIVPDPVRLDVEDFVAAALGEATEVLEKGKTQLEQAYKSRGESKAQSEKRARDFVRAWLKPRPFMRGMLAVRQLDVHVQGRYSGRIIEIGAGIPVKVWWTHPAIPEDQHDLLRESSRLSDAELEAFNQHVKETDLRDVLADTIAAMDEFQDALTRELGEVP